MNSLRSDRLVPAEAQPIGQPYMPFDGGGEAEGQGPSMLAVVLAVVRKRKWILIGAMAIAFLIGLVLTLLATPQYTATATLQLQREGRNIASVEGGQRPEAPAIDQEFYQTQYGLLKSDSLASEVATSLRLQDNAGFFGKFSPALVKAWFDGGRLKPNAPPRAERLRTAAGILLDHLTVDPDRNSQLVRVAFTSPDPQLSKQVADAWGTQFIQSSLDRRYETTAYARNFLEQRLKQLRERLDQSEQSLVEYGAQEGIITVPSGGSDDAATGGGTRDVPLVATNLAALNTELGRATAARIVAQSRLNGGSDVSSEALASSTISTLRARRAEIAADYAKLLQQFDPQFPAAAALRAQLATLDRNIAGEEKRVGASFQDAYQASVAREANLKTSVDQLKSQYTDLRRRGIRYAIIQRDVDTNRQLYAALLQRFKEIGVAGGVGVNNISVVDQAQVPHVPSSPRLFLNLAVALMLGLLVGSGLVLVLEQLDSGFSDPADILSVLGVPLLGTVPKSGNDSPIDALDDPKTAVSEAYASIQTTMNFATDHGFPRTIIVTSSRPSEGKSTTSYALARRLSQLGRSTLLIDGDMRSPSVAGIVGIDGSRGLSNYLSGDDDLGSLIQSLPAISLKVMGSGATPPSTTELLASNRLPRLLAELSKQFDHVVIDSPPVMGLADAPLLSSHVEGTVFAVESNATTKSIARVAVERLLSARAMVIGVILTKFDIKTGGYGYGHGYGYGYGYGSSKTTKNER